MLGVKMEIYAVEKKKKKEKQMYCPGFADKSYPSSEKKERGTKRPSTLNRGERGLGPG